MTSDAAPRWALLGFFLVAVAGVLLRPLIPVDETRYLAVAWEMWGNHNYLVPTKNFELYSHKPPLLFWTINLVWAFTGVSEVAARLVGPLYAVLAIWLTGRLARRLWPKDAGIGGRSVLVLSGMTVFAISGGLTMFDAMLTVATLAGLLALVHALETGAARWWIALGAALAMGVLAKGPVILLHLGPAIVLAPVWARGGMAWRMVLRGGGIALLSALGIVALWLIPAIVTGGPEYRDAILWTQSAGRIATSFAHARPWWFFAALLPVLLFPWILVPAVWKAAFMARWSEPGLRLCAIWGLSALVLFSVISGKQVHYLMPELPAAALIIARLLQDRPVLSPVLSPVFRPVLASVPLILAVGLAMVAASGLVDLGRATRLFHPTPILMAWGLFVLAVCWLAVRTGGLRGCVTLSLGAVLSLNLLVGLTDTRAIYDTHRIAGLIAPFQDRGIAFAGRTYNAEFNFAGRLTLPVALPADAVALTAWQAGHPDGVIVGRPDEVALSWAPHDEILFRNATYAIWHVADAPLSPEPSS